MSNTSSDDPNYRKTIRFTIPDFDEFGEILHDRLHGLVYYIEEMKYKFSLITNYFDRDEDRIAQLASDNEADRERLIYGGTRTQRLLLEKDTSLNKDMQAWRASHNENWQQLHRRIMQRDMQDVQTFAFFESFRDGSLKLKAVKPEYLRDYFSDIEKNDFRRNEFPILKDYFDIKQDKYIGIPLLGMGLFQGIVWIIFDHREGKKFDRLTTVRRLIKLFQINYDNLLLDWDTVGQNIKRKSVVAEAKDVVRETNPIQRSCGLKKYYEIQNNYLNGRIQRNEAVIEQAFKPLNRMAIITILLDSFAHNISAHSLTALSWWFRERAEYLENPDEQEKLRMEQLGQDKNPLILLSKLFPNKTLSRELYPLFKFLLEKGAFWSGITRQTNFTGKSSSLFNILWYDFINNPLYLGTIANTEDVRKLHVNITIYAKEDQEPNALFINTKHIKKTSQNVFLDGTLATINLDDFGKNWTNKKAPAGKSQVIESIFVEKSPLFEVFKSELEKHRAFFPGGVVGKHAFFTLLENEIRNVKHFKGKALEDIQKYGLVLNISIHERPIDSASPSLAEDQLLKIGVWLKHPVALETDLLLRRIEGLEKDIVTVESSQPQLGGNYQDKICATMLLTNSFERVQDNFSKLGSIYYPWIKTAGSRIRDGVSSQIIDFEVSKRKYGRVEKAEFDHLFASQQGPGYLKKYFHLWKGADIMVLNPQQPLQLDLENIARFRFLVLPPNNSALRQQYQCEGILRILETDKPPGSVAEAYRLWLPQWLKKVEGNQHIAFTFWYGKTKTGRLAFMNDTFIYQSYQDLRHFKSTDPLFQAISSIPQHFNLPVEHGGNSVMEKPLLNYRSHGELLSRFFKGKSIQDIEALPENDLGELLEVLATRICIFDRRTYNRLYPEESTRIDTEESSSLAHSNIKAVQRARLELFRNQLLLNFRNEAQADFEAVKQLGFQTFHFLVLHLSFIEGMPDGKGINTTYSEERIIEFIDEQILQGANPATVGSDFMLVITTGRGRMLWWEKIKANPIYARFVTFRPIESILSVVEDAQQIHDDFDMKHNMVKLLFGS